MAQPQPQPQQHHHHHNNNNGGGSSTQKQQHHVLHDFLGMKPNNDIRLSTDLSPSSSSAAARGPFSSSAASDIASEKQVGNHLEGVPYYGPRSDFSGTEISNRLVGNKRSNSDSTFMGSSRDAFQMVPDSFQNSHLMKVLRSAAGGEKLRRPNDDEVLLGMQSLKPMSASLFQPPTNSKLDANKWERSLLMNVGPSMQHPPRGGQLTPFVHQIASNKMRDANAGPSFISQSAADEGSRTGIKGPGILSSINPTALGIEKSSSAGFLGGSRTKTVSNVVDPESSALPSQHGQKSSSRQMTIFYGGQAHVFDDVHPHKADVIMSLAGSNGGSWSTAFSPKSSVKLANDSNLHSGENDTGIPHDLHGRLPITGSSSHAIVPGDRISTPAVVVANQGSIVSKHTRNPVQASEPRSEDKKRAQ
ncbi:protein TIFY 8 isoform X1 [Arachis ipaensis]|uniref:protein TIFY 8 isoform X1 n=1 Tax=Arachis ipaensis TaxID=130454 RepID=UPI0007AF298B|nr:protein TIFY 8 isoform X1 [Arachis ipaensis]XP_025671257.1 protein TIFY 8 isoform X1 [Arachis hypogaea]QHN97866.1 Protein TIFY [Arachis hypogaea]